MLTPRRFAFLIAICTVTYVVFTFLRSHVHVHWDVIPELVGLRNNHPSANEIASGRNILPDLRNEQARLPKHKDVFPPGQAKPAGSQYTRGIVMARTKEEDVNWVDEELGDVMTPRGPFEKYIYVADDPTAPLHPPKNKGHEAMIYLSYIIDHYDSLPDVSIFVHSDRWTWHNNELFSEDLAAMIRYLSPERVTREGYMNLRCHWDPGCPDWIHPGTLKQDSRKKEEIYIAQYWTQLYPEEPVPSVLAQACCAQFAVSRERIQAVPRDKYVHLRDWLLRTNLRDSMSGRFFEYTWQYLFTGNEISCPDMHVCYCDGYGFCFGGKGEFNHWFELQYELEEYQAELRQWNKNQDLLGIAESHGRVDEGADLSIPVYGRDKHLNRKIEYLEEELRRLKEDAFVKGGWPQARAFEAGRNWTEGDGF